MIESRDAAPEFERLTLSTPVAFADDGQWTIGGQNLSNWRNQDETEISPKNVTKLKLKWTFTTGGDVSATPAVAKGIVYFPDFVGNFYAVKADTGALVWQQQIATWTGVTGDFARNDPAIRGNTLILGNRAGRKAFWNDSKWVGSGAKLIAVDAKTGSLRWVTQVEAFPAAFVTSSPVIYKDPAYVGIAPGEEEAAAVVGTPCCVSRGSVFAVDVKTGAIKWQTFMVPDNGGKTGGYSGAGVWDSTPVIDPKRNSVYVGTGNNYSVPNSVKTCFKLNNNYPNCADPKDYFDSVVALDLDTGQVKWAKRACPTTRGT